MVFRIRAYKLRSRVITGMQFSPCSEAIGYELRLNFCSSAQQWRRLYNSEIFLNGTKTYINQYIPHKYYLFCQLGMRIIFHRCGKKRGVNNNINGGWPKSWPWNTRIRLQIPQENIGCLLYFDHCTEFFLVFGWTDSHNRIGQFANMTNIAYLITVFPASYLMEKKRF